MLPSFLARYQRLDVDALSKVLEINLVMTSSYRHTLKILGYAQGVELAWNPERILHIVHWLSDLLPLPSIFLRLGLTVPITSREPPMAVKNSVKSYIISPNSSRILKYANHEK